MSAPFLAPSALRKGRQRASFPLPPLGPCRPSNQSINLSLYVQRARQRTPSGRASPRSKSARRTTNSLPLHPPPHKRALPPLLWHGHGPGPCSAFSVVQSPLSRAAAGGALAPSLFSPASLLTLTQNTKRKRHRERQRQTRRREASISSTAPAIGARTHVVACATDLAKCCRRSPNPIIAHRAACRQGLAGCTRPCSCADERGRAPGPSVSFSLEQGAQHSGLRRLMNRMTLPSRSQGVCAVCT